MTKKEILAMLSTQPFDELREAAAKVLFASRGAHVYVRGLIEFSNICGRNCLYCGLRHANRRVDRYLLEREEILASAAEAVAAGADTIVLQSGEGACAAGWLAEIVAAIRDDLGVAVTLSVGERPRADYRLWREAGASRYLLRHETSSGFLYGMLHPGHKVGERIKCLRQLADVGYEVGGGFMIGLPGQTLESLAEDILLCSRLGLAMVGVGPFLPQADTPLARAASGSASLTLRVLCALRLTMPNANLPATTAVATLDPENGQKKALDAGANVLMPSFTPAHVSGSYGIYDNKNRVDIEDAFRLVESMGRTHSRRAR